MRYFILLLATLFISNSNAQLKDIRNEKDSCYFKKDANGNRIKPGQRYYAQWECGKTVGVLDCGQDLSFDKESNTVFKKATDNVNLAGANKPFTGQCEMCHNNGTKKMTVTFREGKQDGIDTTNYPSGCPQVVRSHVLGVESGQWLYYYDSTGYLAWEQNYYLGELHGKQIYFAEDGDTTKWENYTNGILDGVKRTYYDDSKIKKEVTYKSGIFDGPFKIYNLDGVVVEDLTYKMGKKDGEAIYYYGDGTLLRNESWNNGVKNGEFKTFFYGGEIQVSESYKKGLKEGWFEEYYPNHKLKRRALYEKDELIEEHRYDENGRETYTFGVETNTGAEDDEMPSGDTKKKKKKKKKAKKEEG